MVLIYIIEIWTAFKTSLSASTDKLDLLLLCPIYLVAQKNFSFVKFTFGQFIGKNIV